jgi:pimeloyl-ACP methyl ester carboxylesterase
MKREVSNGLHIGRLDRPFAPRVIFVHGVMDRGATFLPVTRRLTRASWVIYDRRGYGRSSIEAVPTFQDHVADLVTLIERESQDEPVVVVGHSLGGTIALAAVSRVASCVSVVVVHEAPLPWLEWWPLRDRDGRRIEDESTHDAVVRVMERTAGRKVWEALPEAVQGQRLSEGPVMISELVGARESCPFERKDLDMPVVVSRGSHSRGHREQAQEWLVDNLPCAQSHVIDGAAHNVQSTHPREFSELLTSLVEGVNRRHSS